MSLLVIRIGKSSSEELLRDSVSKFPTSLSN